MVPARMGSTRLAKKNLALVGGKPMISYPIIAAQESGVFSEVIINSESLVFQEVATRYGAKFYHRQADLANSTAKSDIVVYDFIQHNPCDIVVWVNPTSPLQPAAEIKATVEFFIENDFDSLITVRNEQVHCVYDNKPLNYSEAEVFAQTQDLIPVQRFVYSQMMWKTSTFTEAYESKGHALLSGRVGYYPVSKESSLIVKTEEDLKLVDYLATMQNSNEQYELKYDSLATDHR